MQSLSNSSPHLTTRNVTPGPRPKASMFFLLPLPCLSHAPPAEQGHCSMAKAPRDHKTGEWHNKTGEPDTKTTQLPRITTKWLFCQFILTPVAHVVICPIHPYGCPKPLMNSMKFVIPLHFISWKKTPNDAVTPQRQSQFTPKMKANAVPRLLSSLV